MSRDTILVVDDDEINTDLLTLIFESENYKVVTYSNGKEALEYLTKNHMRIAVILLDILMPVADGSVILRVMHAKGITKFIPVIIMTADQNSEKISECFANGAVDTISKPFVSVIVRGRVKNIIELFKNKNLLEAQVTQQNQKLQEQNKELKDFNDKLIEVMSNIVEFRNLEEGNHTTRIKRMTRILCEIANRLYPDFYKLTNEKIEIIVSASALHDIGKISISDAILLKPGKLSADEFEVIKSHTTSGCDVLHMIEDLQSKEYKEISYNIVRYHHERYDGTGYPDNLSGEDIPVEAQIVSIIDAYESLVSDTVYRDAFDVNVAYNMIREGKCGVFSETLLTCLEKAKPLLEKVVRETADK